MEFDTGLIKKHPYAVGGIVIVGAIIVFYLLSPGSTAAPVATVSSSGTSDSDAQIAAVNAAAQVSNNQTQAALTATQTAADVTNNQTAAALQLGEDQIAAGTTVNLADISASLTSADNSDYVALMQQEVQKDAVQASVDISANNNATALAAVNDAYTLATTRTADVYSLIGTPIGSTDQGAIALDALLGSTSGATSVAQTDAASNAAVNAANDAEGASQTASITKGITSIINGLF